MNIRDFVKYYDNVAKEHVLKNFLNYAKNTSYDVANVGANLKGEELKKIRNTEINNMENIARLASAPDQLEMSKNQNLTGIHWNNVIQNIITLTNLKYVSDLKLPHNPVSEIENTTLLKYQPGGHYILHVDYATKFKRCLSFIMFCNDDFEGGNLVFSDPDHTNDNFIIKPKRNRVVMFPSNFLYPHKVEEITKGERYTIVSWLV